MNSHQVELSNGDTKIYGFNTEGDRMIIVIGNTEPNNKLDIVTRVYKNGDTKLKDLKKGDFFTLKYIECPKESQVYIKGHYDRTTKSFSCVKFSDTNSERFIKSDKLVFTEFTFQEDEKMNRATVNDLTLEYIVMMNEIYGEIFVANNGRITEFGGNDNESN